MEVWESASNDRTQAVHVANAGGTSFVRQGLAGGVERWYWIRAVDRSKNPSAFFPVNLTGGLGGKTLKAGQADYEDLSITNAVIANGAIDDAKIASLDAAKIIAGSILSGKVVIGGTGQTLDTATQGVTDPAAVINKGTTTILPGKIQLSGGTTLQNILHGGDNTLIDGGKIATGTITANKLIIGLRGIEMIGVEFTAIKETNFVQWTGGIVNYASSTEGQHAAESIVAGGYQWTGQIVYLYWQPGTGSITGTTDANVTSQPDKIVVATYIGGASIHVSYGRTVIDGSGIRARTIGAYRIQANSITANEVSTGKLITASAQIDSGIINTAHINNLAVLDAFIQNLSATKIGSGSINAKVIDVGNRNDGGGYITIDSLDGKRHLAYYDQANVPRVLIGRRFAAPNVDLDGIYVWDKNRKEILSANGLGVKIAGTDQLMDNATAVCHYSDNSNLSFWTAPISQGVQNTTLWSVSVHRDYITYSRLVIQNAAGVIILIVGMDYPGTGTGHEVINKPLVLPASTFHSAYIQELSNAAIGGIPANTWFNASDYPFPRTNPYKITVLEVKR